MTSDTPRRDLFSLVERHPKLTLVMAVLAALLQLVVYSIHTNLVLVRIHRAAGAVHGKRDAAEAVVCLGRNGKAHIRTLGNRAAAIPVNVHARAFRGSNRSAFNLYYRRPHARAHARPHGNAYRSSHGGSHRSSHGSTHGGTDRVARRKAPA